MYCSGYFSNLGVPMLVKQVSINAEGKCKRMQSPDVRWQKENANACGGRIKRIKTCVEGGRAWRQTHAPGGGTTTGGELEQDRIRDMSDLCMI